MWIQTDGGTSFIVLTAHGRRGRRVSVLTLDDAGTTKIIHHSDHPNAAIPLAGQ